MLAAPPAARARGGRPPRRPASLPSDPATRYARDVVAGRIPAGRLHRLACVRHLRDLETARERGLVWDWSRAQHAVSFIGLCRHIKGEWAGQPVLLDPWQQFIIGSIYGWWWAKSRIRRYRTAYVEIPRGNGKSTLAAGVALLEAFALGEPGAEVYCAATTRPQARIVFDTAKAMVARQPAFRRHIRASAHNLHQPASLSKLEPVSADANTLDGLRPQAVIIDELHAHPSSSVVDVMTSGTGTRRMPLVFEITTAGVGRESVCRRHHEYGEAVLEGLYADDAWFVFIAAADPDDDWRAEPTWFKANPGLGAQVKIEQLRTEAVKAAQMPAYQNSFRRYYLNQWVESEIRAIDMTLWNAGARSLTLADLSGRECFLGLDLSMSTDLTAAVFVFPDDDLGVTAWPLVWVPSDAIWLRSQRDRVPMDAWVRDGYLSSTPGASIDYDYVAAEILSVVRAARLTVREVGYDRYNAHQFVGGLERATRWTIVDVPQTVKAQSEPTKRLLALLKDGKFRHPANPVMTWSANNCQCDTDPLGNIRFSKKLSRERIDPMIAAVNAMHRWIAGTAPVASTYSGLVVVDA